MADTDFFTDTEKLKTLSSSEFKKLMSQETMRHGMKRQQKLLNALTTVGLVSIYVVPSVLAVLYLGVLIHKAYMNEWSNLEDTLRATLIPVTTYLAGLLSKNVLPKNSTD